MRQSISKAEAMAMKPVEGGSGDEGKNGDANQIVKRRLSSEVVAENDGTCKEFVDYARLNKERYDRINPPLESKVNIEIPKKSIAGSIWFERSLKKTVALYMIMNAAILFFSSDYYITPAVGGSENTNFIGALYTSNASATVIQTLVTKIIADHALREIPIIGLTATVNGTQNVYVQNAARVEALRPSQLQYYYFSDDPTQVNIVMIEDDSTLSFYASIFEIANLLFAVLVLILTYYSSSNDSEKYLTIPFTKIFKEVNLVLKNPLDYTTNPFYLEPLTKQDCIEDLDPEYEEYAILGNFIRRHSIYLCYAFGARQTRMISEMLVVQKQKNLREFQGEVFNSYIVMIQLYDNSNIISSEDRYKSILVYYKKMVEVIQRTTDKFGGSVQMLTGGKFILIWRLRSDDYQSNFITGNRNSSESAAMCITCILKIITKLVLLREEFSIDEMVREIKMRSGHQDDGDWQLGEEELKDIRDYVNCIVHCGKVYQHLVGGSSKIDTVFLGPDIEYVNKLHEMSMIYNIPIMVTEHVYQFMADSLKKQCRKIDIIKMRNDDKSTDIYSLDVAMKKFRGDEQHNVFEEHVIYELEKLGTTDYRLFHARIKEKILERLINGAKNSIYFEDPDIQKLFLKNPDFKRACRKAIDFYSLGAWDMARSELQNALTMEPDDGASFFLLQFMKLSGFVKPPHWRGYRPTDL